MRMIRPKSGHLRLDPSSYARVRRHSRQLRLELRVMKPLVPAVPQERASCFVIAQPAPRAGASLGNQNPETLLYSMTRFFRFLPGEQQQSFLENVRKKAS